MSSTDSLSSPRTKRAVLPAAWLFGAVVAALLGDLDAPGATTSLQSADTYYVVGRAHYVTGFAVAFVFIGFIYFVLDFLFRLRYRRVLAWGHFGLMAVGSLLIFAPSLFLRLNALPVRFTDPGREVAIWNTVSTTGYGLTLLSAALFLMLLGDALVGQRIR